MNGGRSRQKAVTYDGCASVCSDSSHCSLDPKEAAAVYFFDARKLSIKALSKRCGETLEKYAMISLLLKSTAMSL